MEETIGKYRIMFNIADREDQWKFFAEDREPLVFLSYAEAKKHVIKIKHDGYATDTMFLIVKIHGAFMTYTETKLKSYEGEV